MDDQACLMLAIKYLRDNLIERHHYGLDLGRKQFQRQIGCGQRPGNGHLHPLQIFEPQRARRNHHGPVFLADTAAAGHQRVLVLNIRIGVEGNGAHIVKAFHGFAVQGLDISERVRKFQPGHPDLVGGQAVKHKSIVGIRAMGNTDLASLDRKSRRGHGLAIL